MLDNITKKNIDDCRDVLVGKVPDPKSQIEQITLALIYKFMDDMDKEAVEKFKGKAKFFTGAYSKYGWRKLFDPSLSGADMLALYSEALEKLNTNPNIPELFRNIFKNAYLPYRDPSTLKLFLKYINEFEYSHSEKLGDAFEYLLSVMGSQGDAGQFRTPRHIIDFVTACVNPQKNETVLDPACGTAGFLLSAYKHILNQNTDKRKGDKLKPDDRKKLAGNFVGYDISPDMVRLSLANMYLHGFATPLIHEYDTLSSEDRWQETFDVILANPPFMTPKGGIRPHKKFGVQANKAEVLFTDYIAEHLNKNGRAGIVVPNGIVATSQNAYIQLRKHLVTDSLIAVVSLPAGCFNPYSGVKTSVLMLDKQLAKKSKHILFLKIENDGFDLGAQRREHDKNDLPLALQTLEAFKKCLKDEQLPSLGGLGLGSSLATLVEKQIVLANKDVVLSAERYFVADTINTDYPIVKLEDVCNFIDYRGKTPTKTESGIRLITAKNVKKGYLSLEPLEYIAEADYESWMTRGIPSKGDVLITTEAPLGNVAQIDTSEKIALAQRIITLIPKELSLDKSFLKLALLTDQVQFELSGFATGSTVLGIKSSSLKEISIPLPPLAIQQQIVAEIEGYQKVLDGAKQIVNNYKPTISINPEWETVGLGEVELEIVDGDRGVNYPKKKEFKEDGYCLFLSTKNVREGRFLFDELSFINKEKDNLLRSGKLKRYDVVMTTRGTLGNCAFYDDNVVYKNIRINSGMILFRVKNFNTVNPKYIFYLLQSTLFANQVEKLKSGSAQPQLPIRDLVQFVIPLPTIEEQKEIVKSIEEEMQLVEVNKKLIQLFEQKIKNKINEVWSVKEEVVS
jgi:type I restriction enzyme M protein